MFHLRSLLPRHCAEVTKPGRSLNQQPRRETSTEMQRSTVKQTSQNSSRELHHSHENILQHNKHIMKTYETCVNTCEYYITLGLHSSSYSRQWSLVLYFDAEERCTSGLQVLGLCTMSCSLKLLLLLLSGHFGKNNARTNVLQKIAESILVNLCSQPPVVSAPCSTSKLVHNLQRHAKTRALGHYLDISV